MSGEELRWTARRKVRPLTTLSSTRSRRQPSTSRYSQRCCQSSSSATPTAPWSRPSTRPCSLTALLRSSEICCTDNEVYKEVPTSYPAGRGPHARRPRRPHRQERRVRRQGFQRPHREGGRRQATHLLPPSSTSLLLSFCLPALGSPWTLGWSTAYERR